MSRDQVEDDIFDWMTLRSFCSSPYLDHPPKAAKVLGTLGSKSPRHELCQQGPERLHHPALPPVHDEELLGKI